MGTLSLFAVKYLLKTINQQSYRQIRKGLNIVCWVPMKVLETDLERKVGFANDAGLAFFDIRSIAFFI